MYNLGRVDLAQSRYEEAAGNFTQALVLARETGDQVRQARALINLGVIDTQRSRHHEAIGYLQQALAVVAESGDRISYFALKNPHGGS
jgi:tetratricopeptide (TPR) repeat protein